MTIGIALQQLHEAETALAEDCRTIADSHATDQEIHDTCRRFAEQCEQHAEQLRPQAQRHGIEIGEHGGSGAWHDLFDMVRHRDYEVIGRQADPGLRLLRDLRHLFLTAEDTSIRWVIAGEAARAAGDEELLAVVRACHPETESHAEWLRARIKLTVPQALASE
jgi:hypothetical protein